MTHYDLTTSNGCKNALVDMRHVCRRLCNFLQPHWAGIRSMRRSIRLLRAQGDAMSARRADVLQDRVDGYQAELEPFREQLTQMGSRLFYCASYIDKAMPQGSLLDVLNVNPIDRNSVEVGDGLVLIVFGRGLENSVEGRENGFLDTPLFKACQFHFSRKLATDQALRDATEAAMFGAGGMFEFLPKYQQQPDGTMRRVPPKLRIADPAIDGKECGNG